jgi:hypothetical protein
MTEQNIQEAVTGLMQRIIDHSTTAQRLKSVYVVEMQKTSGYTPSTGVTILKDVSGNMSGVTDSNGTFYNVKGALAATLIAPVKTEPSNELISAVDALESDIKNLQGLVNSFATQYTVSVKTGRKSSGTRSTRAAGTGKLVEVLSIDPNARIALVDVGMSHPHIQGVLSNGKSIDIDCYAATLTEHIYKALGRA